ncbi:MAG: UDP-N-acetylmuramate dehydrogenase [Candidatus Paceibacterota bacterium]
MNIQENVALAQYTTFKIGGSARFFCHVSTEDELLKALAFASEKKLRVFILGGGSNILISDKGFPGLVIKIELRGVTYRTEGDRTIVSAAAGEMWDELVEETVERGLYGLENLSAIPGTVGAAPVQNIGAYGTEASDTIVSVRVLDRQTSQYRELNNQDCHFAYRDSVFKEDRARYVITRVNFSLSAKGEVNTRYRDVDDYFKRKTPPVANPTPRDIRAAVIDIRWHKLPDWKLWGTAGSFFKNPTITIDKWHELKKAYPDLPGYPEPDGRIKLSLGWILDNVCHAKDLCLDGVCVYEKQALVIVAKPGSTAADVVNLAQELMNRVKEKTGVEVTGEVEWVN